MLQDSSNKDNKTEVVVEKEPVPQTDKTNDKVSASETTTTTTAASTEKEKEKEEPKEEKKEENKEKKFKFDYAPQRQAHCFIYYIKKLTE